MRIGQIERGNEGVVTRINLMTVRKVWNYPGGKYKDPIKNFRELKRRVSKLPLDILNRVKFIYPRKTVKENGKTVSYFRYIPGKFCFTAFEERVGNKNIRAALSIAGIEDFHSFNVIEHRKTKKLYFIDPRVATT